MSVRTLFAVTLYMAVCCLIFVWPNLWVGTVVVIATDAYLAIVAVQAFRLRNPFCMGFSIAAWSWIVFWLGFMADTDKAVSDWPLPRWIWATSPMDSSTDDETATAGGKLHSLILTSEYASGPGTPNCFNYLRTFVCVTALAFGTAVGGLSQWFVRRRRASNASYAGGLPSTSSCSHSSIKGQSIAQVPKSAMCR